jgi:hypothetical protein
MRAGLLVINALECWALAELVYYYTHDGETLHDAVAGYVLERVEHHREITRAIREVRDLPES